jgi:predicted site-specific integrase-resolvase
MVTAKKPQLKGDMYLNNKDVCKLLHISSRTLQEYRDKGTIAFIRLEGKNLYKQSDIDKLLEDNYFPVFE